MEFTYRVRLNLTQHLKYDFSARLARTFQADILLSHAAVTSPFLHKLEIFIALLITYR